MVWFWYTDHFCLLLQLILSILIFISSTKFLTHLRCFMLNNGEFHSTCTSPSRYHLNLPPTQCVVMTQTPQVCLHLPLQAAERTTFSFVIFFFFKHVTHVCMYTKALTTQVWWDRDQDFRASLDAVTSSLIDPLFSSDRRIICRCMGLP